MSAIQSHFANGVLNSFSIRIVCKESGLENGQKKAMHKNCALLINNPKYVQTVVNAQISGLHG